MNSDVILRPVTLPRRSGRHRFGTVLNEKEEEW
jgi:hypothetical protein